MLLKTKDRKNEQAPTSVIPGRSVGAPPESGMLAPDSWLLTPAFQKMKVHPEMLLKTKERRNEQAPTSVIPGRPVGAPPESGMLAPDSWLLSPAFQKMKVHPEMLLKTKERRNEQAPTSVIPGRSVGALPESGMLAPGSRLLSPALQEMKVHPAICMKTQTGQETSSANW